MDTKGKAIVGSVLGAGALAALLHWWPSGKAGTATALPSSSTSPVASPEVHGASPSTAAFVPGAARLRPLVRVSRWHAFPPGIEIVTRLRHGHGVQVWSVAPDGVTLTAASEPIVATPELLARADADLMRARWIGPHRFYRDPHMGTAGKPVVFESERPEPLTPEQQERAKALIRSQPFADCDPAIEALSVLLALRGDR